jgi:hypothetical protein
MATPTQLDQDSFVDTWCQMVKEKKWSKKEKDESITFQAN